LTRRDIGDLLLIAALWGGSFLFMRIASPEFGPFALMAIRAGIGAACLLPWLMVRGLLRPVIENAHHMLVLGLLGSALPFVLFAYAMLTLTAGQGAIINAVAPLWGAIIAYLWMRERPTGLQVIGLLVGFGGVVALVWGKAAMQGSGALTAAAAGLVATLSYGVSSNYTRRYLAHVDSLANAGGSLVAATLLLVVPGVLFWPQAQPSTSAWLAAAVLGVACTGLAYVLFFRLIAKVGAPRTMTTIFLVPLFGVLWGSLFLGERIDAWVAAAGLTILLGTALAAGIVRMRVRRPAAPLGTRGTR
jgi:drug/metabolite transporter (DMT)-like permease